MDMQDQTNRLKVLWKSGRDKYRSFFSVLAEVQAEIGSEALPKYCLEELHIGMSVITMATKLLGAIDEKIAKDALAEANKAKEEARAKEAAEKKKAREEEAHQKELEKAKRAAAVAAAVAEATAKANAAKAEADAKAATMREEAVKKAAAAKKAEDAEKRRQNRQGDPKERGSKAAAQRKKRTAVSGKSDADLAALIERYKSGDQMCERGLAQWIEGSIIKALILCEMRGRFTADQEFGAWFDKSGIKLSHQDRAALIGLGRLGETKMRAILTDTDSRSYRLIWGEYKPVLKVVEN